MMHDTKLAVDGAIATGAITLPWWIVGMNEWAGIALTLATLALIIVRLALAIREFMRND